MRYDLPNYTDYFDYKISSYRGIHSSFEREYYDLSYLYLYFSKRGFFEILLLIENW